MPRYSAPRQLAPPPPPLPTFQDQLDSARIYNQSVANSGRWSPDYTAPIDLNSINQLEGKTASKLMDGYVPWQQFGRTNDPTIPLQPAAQVVSSLQNDNEFKSLSDPLQELVLHARGGEEAVRHFKTLKALELLSAKTNQEHIAKLQGERDELQLTPIKRIHSMIMEGNLRPRPEGGLEVFQDSGDGTGMKKWMPADQQTMQFASAAWPVMFGQAVPLNKDQQRALGILKDNPNASNDDIRGMMGGQQPKPMALNPATAAHFDQPNVNAPNGYLPSGQGVNFLPSERSGPNLGFNAVPQLNVDPNRNSMFDLHTQQGVNSYNQTVADSQTGAPGSAARSAALSALSKFFEQPSATPSPAAASAMGDQTPYEKAVEYGTTYPISFGVNALRSGQDVGAGILNFLFGTQIQARPKINPQQVATEFYRPTENPIPPSNAESGGFFP